MNNQKYYYKYTKMKLAYLRLKYGNANNFYSNIQNNNMHGGSSVVNANLAKIYKMSFEGFNSRNWDILHDTMHDDITTIFSNGMTMYGYEASVNMLMRQAIDWAPDIKVSKYRFNF